MSKRTGIDAATRAAMDRPALPAPSEPEREPELFPEIVEPDRKPGRPAGAMSKKTRDFLQYQEEMPDLQLPGVWLA